MEHVILLFQHDIRDVIPYSEFVQAIRPLLAQNQLGEYVGDDMAIDGGDAEAIFAGKNARPLYAFLLPYLQKLPFLRDARVKLVCGPIESGSLIDEFMLGART